MEYFHLLILYGFSPTGICELPSKTQMYKIPKYFIIILISGYHGGEHRGGGGGGHNYNRGGNRYEDRRGGDNPGSHANFGRRDRRDSDRRPPNSDEFREPTAGKF